MHDTVHTCTFQDGEEAGGFECRVQDIPLRHEDKVEDLMEHLDNLVKTAEPVMPHTSGMGDH